MTAATGEQAQRRTGTTRGNHLWVAIDKANGRVTWQCGACEMRIETQTGYTPSQNTMKRWVNGVPMRRTECLPKCIGKPLTAMTAPPDLPVVSGSDAPAEEPERALDSAAAAVAEVVRLRAEVRALRSELVAAQRASGGQNAGRVLTVTDTAPWSVWAWLVGEATRAVSEAWKNGAMPNARQQESIRTLVATIWGRSIFHDYEDLEDARAAIENSLHKTQPGRRYGV